MVIVWYQVLYRQFVKKTLFVRTSYIYLASADDKKKGTRYYSIGYRAVLITTLRGVDVGRGVGACRAFVVYCTTLFHYCILCLVYV